MFERTKTHISEFKNFTPLDKVFTVSLICLFSTALNTVAEHLATPIQYIIENSASFDTRVSDALKLLRNGVGYEPVVLSKTKVSKEGEAKEEVFCSGTKFESKNELYTLTVKHCIDDLKGLNFQRVSETYLRKADLLNVHKLSAVFLAPTDAAIIIKNTELLSYGVSLKHPTVFLDSKKVTYKDKYRNLKFNTLIACTPEQTKLRVTSVTRNYAITESPENQSYFQQPGSSGGAVVRYLDDTKKYTNLNSVKNCFDGVIVGMSNSDLKSHFNVEIPKKLEDVTFDQLQNFVPNIDPTKPWTLKTTRVDRFSGKSKI